MQKLSYKTYAMSPLAKQPPLFLFGKTAHISLGPLSTPMMSLLGKIANYIMSPMGRPNNQFTCKGWKDFLEP